MVLIKNFKATTFAKAFALNAIAIGISAGLTVLWHEHLAKEHSGGWKFAGTVVGAVIISLIAFLLLYYLFGFGGGMLAN